MKKTSNGGVKFLRAAALIFGGAVAWIILSSSQASAITIADQDNKTTNTGAAVSNTGVNKAVGNTSKNTADVDQDADADASGKGDAVAVNTGTASNNSNGTASIHTGDAHSTGNSASNHSSQVMDADGGGIVVADQNNQTTNRGLGVANTGVNLAVGNNSNNTADLDQDADADTNGSGDAVAVNIGNAYNNSTGSASIHTGNATAIGNHAHNWNIQSLDTGDSHLTVVDQTHQTTNSGFALANTGVNFALGSAGGNSTSDIHQSADADGGNDDAVAVNTGNSVNNSAGSAHIATGNAHAIGNTSSDTNTQVLDVDDVSATRAGSNPAIPLALLLGFLFVGTPARRLATRRR